MDNAADYLAYLAPSAGEGELSQLRDLAEEQAAAAARVAELEAQLTAARDAYRDLAERRVPELMDRIGMGEFTTTSGLRIKVKENIRASIPKAKAPLAMAWLKTHGAGSLIKRTVKVVFGKGEDEVAEKLAQELYASRYQVEDDAAVHPSTLTAFVKEKLQKGEELPLDLFGVHRQRVAEIDN